MKLALVFLTLLAVVRAQVAQTFKQSYKFTNTYSTSWYSYEDTDGKLWLRQTLKINNVDISTWKTANGNFGYWLGIGYGTTIMAGSDIYLCTFRYYGLTSDTFYCYDDFANAHSVPISDQSSEVIVVSSNTTFNWPQKLVNL